MTDASAPQGARLGRRGVERLDLLLLTIEALDLNAGEFMLWTSHQMGCNPSFPTGLNSGNGVVTTHCGAPHGGNSWHRWMRSL